MAGHPSDPSDPIEASFRRVVLATLRGAFAAKLFGHPDAECEDPSPFHPVIFLVHGAGMSSDGFVHCALALQVLAASNPAAAAPLASEGTRRCAAGGPMPLLSGPGLFDAGALPESRPSQQVGLELRVVALDLRAHGETAADETVGLSLDTLVQDVKGCIHVAMDTLFPARPTFYMCGHSLGGAICAKLAQDADIKPRLAGLVLLDIVEDTAKASLEFMDQYLEKRPATFVDPADAVRWMLTKGGMRNADVARWTVPRLLRLNAEGKWGWRTDLAATKPYWGEWFNGMDDYFIRAGCPKVLCLATTQRLDTKLTVAQMQGKFQFEVIGSHVGHYLMEDDPHAVALKLAVFLKRVEALTAKLSSRSRPPGNGPV